MATRPSPRFIVLGLALLAAARFSGCGDDSDSSTGYDSGGGGSEESAAPSDGAVDPNLVGGWRYTHVYGSGDFTGVVDEYLWLNGDGSYREGGNAAAGDSGSSFVTGDDGSGAAGRWMTKDEILYVMPNGDSEWSAVARYAFYESNAVFYYGGGGRRIWEPMG